MRVDMSPSSFVVYRFGSFADGTRTVPGMPGICPGMRLPPIMERIIFLAPSKSLSSELTSAVVTPDPFAIRRRRDPLMIPGSRRSA